MSRNISQHVGSDKPTLLYVVGTGRSGSTLVANLVGEPSAAFSAGEVRFLWQRAMIEGRPCACTKDIADCEVWSQVLEGMGDDANQVAPKMASELREATRIRALGKRQGLSPASALVLNNLYHKMFEASDARVVVDSSKLPSYALLLERTLDIEIKYLHITRDPRASSFSWLRGSASRAITGLDDEMHHIGTAKSSLLWHLWNRTAVDFGRRWPDRYLHVRYEDLMEHPQQALDEIGTFAGLRSEDDWPVIDDGQIQLSSNHTVAGNPSRFRSGATKLSIDTEWREGLPSWRGAATTALTSPLLQSLGYPIRWRG